MHDPAETPRPSPHRGEKEYQDPHYHDDDGDVPTEDEPRRPRLPGRQKPVRKLPSRRRYE